MIKYVGKCLIIEEQQECCVVIGDLHLGLESSIGIGGVALGRRLLDEDISYLERIFATLKKKEKIERIILLGDIKHGFSEMKKEERDELAVFFSFLKEKAEEIVVISGNHDGFLIGYLNRIGIGIRDYFIWKEYCFMHGDKKIIGVYDEKVKYWIMGHLHPAVNLRDRVKSEKYKCFLDGEYESKRVIILPSFSEVQEGSDVSERGSNLAWEFKLDGFNVFIVGKDFEVLDFGKLGKIK